MARVIEFNPDEALEKAMRVFWQKGYSKTSVRDLVAETGVAHAGLYNVFGGKLKIFEAALEMYNRTVVTALLDGLEGEDASRQAIEDFFARFILIVKTKGFRDGCLMCNTAIEFGEVNGKALAKVERHFERLVRAFTAALERAKERGEVSANLDPDSAAEFFACTLNGLAALIRAKTEPARIERIIEVALKILG